MNQNNLILIKGGAYSDVKKALQQWLALYSDQLETDFEFEIGKNGRGNHVIQVDERLSNELFFYLVNYLAYPEEIFYKVDVHGFTRGKEQNTFRKQELMVYLPENDTEYDCVLVTTESQISYHYSFGSKVRETESTKVYQHPPVYSDVEAERLTVPEASRSTDKFDRVLETIEKPDWRMRMLLIIFLCSMFAFICVAASQSPEITRIFLLSIGVGLFLWFFADYKLLQNTLCYKRCLLFALIYFVGVLTYVHLSDSDPELRFFAFGPLMLLAIQWPLRRWFIILVGREPIVDKIEGKFIDALYAIGLVGITLFTSYGLSELVKVIQK